MRRDTLANATREQLHSRVNAIDKERIKAKRNEDCARLIAVVREVFRQAHSVQPITATNPLASVSTVEPYTITGTSSN